MISKRMTVVVVVGMLLMASALAVSVFGQWQGEEGSPRKAAGVIQYKVVPVPSPMTQAQLQTLMTQQGNGGWRFVAPFAVGTGPIPSQEVFLFSKP